MNDEVITSPKPTEGIKNVQKYNTLMHKVHVHYEVCGGAYKIFRDSCEMYMYMHMCMELQDIC